MVRPSRTIAVISGKGGVGKTTVSLNLGTALVRNFRKSVIVVDCNVTTSHLGLHVGLYYHPTSFNKVLKSEADIHEAVHDHHTGVKIVPASLALSELKGVDMSKIKEKVGSLSESNDIIILDAGPGLGREAIACIKAADEVLYVTTPYVPSVMDIIRCKEIVNESGIKELGIVVNMSEGDKHEMNKQEIEQLTRLPVISVIPQDKNVKRSLHAKMPVVVHRPYSRSSRAFNKLARTVIGEIYEEPGFIERMMHRIRNIRS